MATDMEDKVETTTGDAAAAESQETTTTAQDELDAFFGTDEDGGAGDAQEHDDDGAAKGGEEPGETSGSQGDAEDQKPDEAGDDDSGSDLPGGGEEISPVLVDRAKKAGLSIAEVRAFGSNVALETALDLIEAAKGATEGKGDASEDDPFAVKLSKEKYDDDIVNELQRIGNAARDAVKNANDRVARLEQQLVAQTKAVEEQRIKAEISAFDKWCDSKADLAHVLGTVNGKGSTALLKQKGGKSLFDNREKVWRQAAKLAETYRDDPDPPSREELFEIAAAAVFRNEVNKNARKQVLDKIESTSRSSIGRPAGADVSQRVKDPVKRAESAVAAALRQHGLKK